MSPPGVVARRGRGGPREVCFVKYYEKGSTDIAGDQMAAALLRHGIASRSLPIDEARQVRDAILVFVKRIDLRDLLRARLQGNALVLDVQDTLVFKRGIRYAAAWDGVIFRSARALADYGHGPGAVLIPQHWDERYGLHRHAGDRLRAAFIGDPRSYPFPAPIPGLELVFDDWFARARDFNAHVSVRSTRREILYKPNNKVATAAACGAVLITIPDEAAREHLGDDYPFYCDGTAEAVTAPMRRADGLVGGVEWQRALAVLERVRERTSLARTTELYIGYLSRFGELRTAPAEEPRSLSA